MLIVALFSQPKAAWQTLWCGQVRLMNACHFQISCISFFVRWLRSLVCSVGKARRNTADQGRWQVHFCAGPFPAVAERANTCNLGWCWNVWLVCTGDYTISASHSEIRHLQLWGRPVGDHHRESSISRSDYWCEVRPISPYSPKAKTPNPIGFYLCHCWSFSGFDFSVVGRSA